MELDKAFRFAAILAWEDLAKISNPSSVRVEYQSEAGTTLGHVNVWSTGADGSQNLVCDYWTSASLTHPGGLRFSNGYFSAELADVLDFIMTKQEQFTRPAGDCRDGLALIYPPTADERAEAEAWLGAMQKLYPDLGGGEVPKPPPSAFSQIERHTGPSSA